MQKYSKKNLINKNNTDGISDINDINNDNLDVDLLYDLYGLNCLNEKDKNNEHILSAKEICHLIKNGKIKKFDDLYSYHEDKLTVAFVILGLMLEDFDKLYEGSGKKVTQTFVIDDLYINFIFHRYFRRCISEWFASQVSDGKIKKEEKENEMKRYDKAYCNDYKKIDIEMQRALDESISLYEIDPLCIARYFCKRPKKNNGYYSSFCGRNYYKEYDLFFRGYCQKDEYISKCSRESLGTLFLVMLNKDFLLFTHYSRNYEFSYFNSFLKCQKPNEKRLEQAFISKLAAESKWLLSLSKEIPGFTLYLSKLGKKFLVYIFYGILEGEGFDYMKHLLYEIYVAGCLYSTKFEHKIKSVLETVIDKLPETAKDKELMLFHFRHDIKNEYKLKRLKTMIAIASLIASNNMECEICEMLQEHFNLEILKNRAKIPYESKKEFSYWIRRLYPDLLKYGEALGVKKEFVEFLVNSLSYESVTSVLDDMDSSGGKSDYMVLLNYFINKKRKRKEMLEETIEEMEDESEESDNSLSDENTSGITFKNKSIIDIDEKKEEYESSNSKKNKSVKTRKASLFKKIKFKNKKTKPKTLKREKAMSHKNNELDENI